MRRTMRSLYRMLKSDLKARQIYARARDSIGAHV